MAGYSSPLLDEYNRTGVVTAPLQRALSDARSKLAPALPGGVAATQPGGLVPSPGVPSAAIPAASIGAPASGNPTAPAVPASAAPAAASPMTPAPTGHQQELMRLTKPPLPSSDPGAHTAADTGQSGIGQIHNPWLRMPLKILDAIGSSVLPSLTMGLPGTQLHHQLLVNAARGNVKVDEGQQNTEAENKLRGAQTSEAQAKANEANQPADKNKPMAVKAGEGIWNPEKGAWDVEPTSTESTTEIRPDIAQNLGIAPTKDGKYVVPNSSLGSLLKPKEAAGKAEDEPLGKSVSQINDAMAARYQVLHKGAAMPEHYILPADATRGDFARIDKLMEGEEHAFGTKANQDASAAARDQARNLAQQNRQDKQDTGTKQAAYKAYQPALDSAERFNVMTKNYEDAVKNHDQQAMLSLLSNHLGMTMGAIKGGRITKDIIAEAEHSRPWLQGMQAKFDNDGVLSGVTLTPTQMRQMVNLGREKFSEDLKKSHNEAKYMGSDDEGPERAPNQSTVNHYLGLANGDRTKAKELMAKDGWTVQ